MRNRITLTIATILLVIATVAAFRHPARAQVTTGPNQPGITTGPNLPAGVTTGPNLPAASTPSGTVGSSGAASASTDTSTYNSCGFLNVRGCVVEIIANVGNSILDAVSYLVIVAGSVMSFSIVLTLHIREFVSATPAIFQVWTTLRDVTSLFFIFFLLFAAFKIILGMDEKIGELIKNLVMAGILINFSFFITGALIDASNIVSQTLYNAMVPVSVSSAAANDIATGNINTMVHDVTGIDQNSSTNVDSTKYGIADIFRNALKLSSVAASANSKDTIADPLKAFFIISVGIIIMATACFSFIIAAAAFIIRLVMLIFLLAVSPLWFASWVIPQIKKEFNFWGHLSTQLIFMPVYLLLMYIALKVIAGSQLLTAANASIAGAGATTNWAFSYVVLAVNFGIVIVLLNLPLVVGVGMSGQLGSMVNKFNADSILKWTRGKAIGAGKGAWTYSGGRAASAIARSEGLKDFASQKGLAGGLGRVALKSIRGTAGGYEKKLGEQVKSRTDFANSLGYNEGAVSYMERNVRLMKQREQAYRSLNTPAGTLNAERVKRLHENLQKQIVNKKKERQASYAEDLIAGGVIASAPNLWQKTPRKDKVAGAKILAEVWQKQLEQKKDDLKEVRGDLKQLKNTLRGNKRGTGMVTTPAGWATTKQQDELSKLEAKESKLVSNPAHAGNISDMGVNELQDLIDQQKLIK